MSPRPRRARLPRRRSGSAGDRRRSRLRERTAVDAVEVIPRPRIACVLARSYAKAVLDEELAHELLRAHLRGPAVVGQEVVAADADVADAPDDPFEAADRQSLRAFDVHLEEVDPRDVELAR